MFLKFRSSLFAFLLSLFSLPLYYTNSLLRGNSFYFETGVANANYTGLAQSGALIGKNLSGHGFLENRIGTKFNIELLTFPENHYPVDVFYTGYKKEEAIIGNKITGDQYDIYLTKNISKHKKEAFLCEAIFAGFDSSYIEGNTPSYGEKQQIMYGKIAQGNQSSYGFYAFYNQSGLCENGEVKSYKVNLPDSTILQVVPTQNLTWSVIQKGNTIYLQPDSSLRNGIKLGAGWHYQAATHLNQNQLLTLFSYAFDNETVSQYLLACEQRYLANNISGIVVSMVPLPLDNSYKGIGNNGTYIYLFGTSGDRTYISLLSDQLELRYNYYPYKVSNGSFLFSKVVTGGPFFFMTKQMNKSTLIYSNSFLNTKSQCVRFHKKNLSLPSNYNASYPSFNLSNIGFVKINVSYGLPSLIALKKTSENSKSKTRCQGDRYKQKKRAHLEKNNHATRAIWAAYVFAFCAIIASIFLVIYKYLNKRSDYQKETIERVRKEMNTKKVQSTSTEEPGNVEMVA